MQFEYPNFCLFCIEARQLTQNGCIVYTAQYLNWVSLFSICNHKYFWFSQIFKRFSSFLWLSQRTLKILILIKSWSFFILMFRNLFRAIQVQLAHFEHFQNFWHHMISYKFFMSFAYTMNLYTYNISYSQRCRIYVSSIRIWSLSILVKPVFLWNIS
jgi:hypothetical protein